MNRRHPDTVAETVAAVRCPAGVPARRNLVVSGARKPLPTELKYRNSLIAYLRGHMRGTPKVESEYRHLGTTTDIYVEQSGFISSSEVFVELKRNLLSKAQLDRLVGQIESLEPKKRPIVVILFGDTNPALLARLKGKYLPAGYLVYNFEIIVKEPPSRP